MVTLRRTADKIIKNFHKNNACNGDEKKYIIKTAAKLIKEDIKSISQQTNLFPTSNGLHKENALSFVPSSLQELLSEMFAEKAKEVKLAFIGQAIMQAVRPRALICPLQLGLAVDFHNFFQSKYAVEVLDACGFGASYSTVVQYERSAALCKGTTFSDGAFSDKYCVQYISDNADYNPRTLDGRNTLHVMGMVATVTPAIKTVTCVPKIKVSAMEIKKAGAVDITSFCPEVLKAPKNKYGSLPSFVHHESSKYVNLLWKSSLLLCYPRPSWQGLMQNIYKSENHPGKASVIFLPMINLNPTDMVCMHSTLSYPNMLMSIKSHQLLLLTSHCIGMQ